MYIHKQKIEVRYCETDKMGIVHHSNYAKYFEITRIHFLNNIGIDFFEFEKTGHVSPVLSLNIDFKSSSMFGDVLDVECKIKSFNGVRMFFEYTITNQNGKLIATAVSAHAFTTPDLFPIRIKNKFPDYYEKLINAME